MNRKENKGGRLSNEQVEKELERTKSGNETGGYRGSQDTGDSIVREKGTDVQKTDGTGDTEEEHQ